MKKKIILLLTLIFSFKSSSWGEEKIFILCYEKNFFGELENLLTKNKIRIYHAFAPYGMITSPLDPDLSRHLKEKVKIYTKKIKTLEGIKERGYFYPVYIWNSLQEVESKAKRNINISEDLPPPPNDMLSLPISFIKKVSRVRKAPLSYAPGFFDISEYMIGKVAVGIILPESNGTIDKNSEDWSEYQIQQVYLKIVEGYNFWQEANEKAYLSFYYEIQTVTTSYEPISRYGGPPEEGEEHLWISEVLDKIGYSHSDYFQQVYMYANALRKKFNTHWANVIFVANSLNDRDGAFAPEGSPFALFAYAYVGGPFMVMTYDNNHYGIEYMNAVAAHEIGHLFYACDEYEKSKCSVEHRSGYFNIQNGNHELGGEAEPCIMRGGIDPFLNKNICKYTRGQVGWQDLNHNGIEDILDTLKIYPPSIESKFNEVCIFGSVTLLPPLPNRNSYVHSQGEHPGGRNDITIATIANVNLELEQYNNSSSYYATATDNSFDEPEENYSISIPYSDLLSGPCSLTVSARINPGEVNYPQNATSSFFIPGISIKKEASCDVVLPQGTICYTIFYENWANSTITTCTIKDHLPYYCTYMENSASHEGSAQYFEAEIINSNIIKFSLSSIPPRGVGRIIFTVRVK
jgi:uncharacterized repeat protein (TIGR01451 family)